MGSQDKKPHDPGKRAPEESPVIRELRRRLAEPGPWPQRFRRLAEAIAGAPNLSCKECDDLLDLYVDEELQGRPVQEMYPPIWRHLHTCPQCREAHNLLADVLKLERRGESVPSRTGHPLCV